MFALVKIFTAFVQDGFGESWFSFLLRPVICHFYCPQPTKEGKSTLRGFFVEAFRSTITIAFVVVLYESR
jgi:hypothetical protein